jgi:catechol 2,3-dioxygenase-like lactoylglutathione lyase family enzyme
MIRYVDSTEQLVVELFVRDLRRSVDFYRALGFALLEARPTFANLSWEGHRLFLDQRSDLPEAPATPVMNVRVMVTDVDRVWRQVNDMGLRIVAPIADRPYGLRDFTIADPDGFGVRFGTHKRCQDPLSQKGS